MYRQAIPKNMAEIYTTAYMNNTTDVQTQGLDLKKIDESQIQITPQSITRLRRQLRETAAFRIHLQNDVSKNDQIITYLKSIVQSSTDSSTPKHPLNFLGSPSETAQAIKPVSETAAFTVEQAKTLRQMVNKLQTSSEHILKNGRERDDGNAMDVDAPVDPNSRDTYVERMTRRYLENVRGLQLTREGSLKNGEGDSSEAKKTEAEAAALEEFVENLENTQTLN